MAGFKLEQYCTRTPKTHTYVAGQGRWDHTQELGLRVGSNQPT